MANLISSLLVFTTMRMRNEWGSIGSGFLVQREIGPNESMFFFVTNKHVIHPDPRMRTRATKFIFDCNVKTETGDITDFAAEVEATFVEGGRIWREHPDPDVDIAAMNITTILVALEDRHVHQVLGYLYFADKAKREQFDIAIGDEVAVIGYPSGITQGTSNLPIVRSGIVASHIGQILEEDCVENSGGTIINRRRRLRGFLFDGATIPGSSGSPVFLWPSATRVEQGELKFYGDHPPIVLLGIVAETRFAPVAAAGGLLSFAGLGLAFDADAIRETIELFFP